MTTALLPQSLHAQVKSRAHLEALLDPRVSRATGAASQRLSARAQQLLQELDRIQRRAFSAKEHTADDERRAEEARRELSEVTEDLPQVDLEIQFGFNSTQVATGSIRQLRELGATLQGPKLKGRAFLIAGHTDAKGKASINLAISKRRADAVAKYLVEKFNVDPLLLRTVGYGKERLKLPNAPLSAANRRVQIVLFPEEPRSNAPRQPAL